MSNRHTIKLSDSELFERLQEERGDKSWNEFLWSLLEAANYTEDGGDFEREMNEERLKEVLQDVLEDYKLVYASATAEEVEEKLRQR